MASQQLDLVGRLLGKENAMSLKQSIYCIDAGVGRSGSVGPRPHLPRAK